MLSRPFILVGLVQAIVVVVVDEGGSFESPVWEVVEVEVEVEVEVVEVEAGEVVEESSW